MPFLLNIAKLTIGFGNHISLQSIALEAMEEGLDSLSLRILAGLANNEYPTVVDHYFSEAIKELKIVLPDKRTAAVELALWIVDEIIAGRKSVFDGAKEIIDKTIGEITGDKSNTFYAYDSIAFEKAYDLFYTIDDLHGIQSPWQNGQPVEELKKQATQELLNELKIWATKIKSHT